MKEKIKKIIFGYLPGFVLGVITAISISVIAATYFPSKDVTYDNKESGLTSTDVQGAIDELYTECTTKPAGEQIIEEAGLEKDPYECRYFFTGANPNNYVTFNGEEAGWRIISVECDETIKIMRINNIGYQEWDDSPLSNNWGSARLNTYLNGTYYNGLNEIAQSQIVVKYFSIGAVTYDNNDLADQVNNENATKWNRKVALVTVSEYLRSNSNKSSCGSFSLNNDNYSSCRNTNWMYINDYWWTLSPRAGTSDYSLRVLSNGHVSDSSVHFDAAVRPALYLSSEVKITGGTGTESDPYILS